MKKKLEERPLTVRQFKATETPRGEYVEVPVENWLSNPIIQILIGMVVVGVLKVWFSFNMLEVLLPSVQKEVIQGVSDTVLVIITPAILAILELNRKNVNTLK
jgi:hypothetical protein